MFEMCLQKVVSTSTNGSAAGSVHSLVCCEGISAWFITVPASLITVPAGRRLLTDFVAVLVSVRSAPTSRRSRSTTAVMVAAASDRRDTATALRTTHQRGSSPRKPATSQVSSSPGLLVALLCKQNTIRYDKA